MSVLQIIILLGLFIGFLYTNKLYSAAYLQNEIYYSMCDKVAFTTGRSWDKDEELRTYAMNKAWQRLEKWEGPYFAEELAYPTNWIIPIIGAPAFMLFVWAWHSLFEVGAWGLAGFIFDTNSFSSEWVNKANHFFWAGVIGFTTMIVWNLIIRKTSSPGPKTEQEKKESEEWVKEHKERNKEFFPDTPENLAIRAKCEADRKHSHRPHEEHEIKEAEEFLTNRRMALEFADMLDPWNKWVWRLWSVAGTVGGLYISIITLLLVGLGIHFLYTFFSTIAKIFR